MSDEAKVHSHFCADCGKEYQCSDPYCERPTLCPACRPDGFVGDEEN